MNFSLPIFRPLPWAATCALRRGTREFRVSHRRFFVEERFGAFASPRGAATRPISRARLAALVLTPAEKKAEARFSGIPRAETRTRARCVTLTRPESLEGSFVHV